MDSLHLRIRLDRAVAEKAMALANARGLELPDVIRMMIDKAVRTGSFSIDEELAPLPGSSEAARPFHAYDERQWNSMKLVLDAELAMGLLNQYIATCTLRIEELIATNRTDAEARASSESIQQLKAERMRAAQLLGHLDPTNAATIRQILEEFGPPPSTPSSLRPPLAADGTPGASS